MYSTWVAPAPHLKLTAFSVAMETDILLYPACALDWNLITCSRWIYHACHHDSMQWRVSPVWVAVASNVNIAGGAQKVVLFESIGGVQAQVGLADR